MNEITKTIHALQATNSPKEKVEILKANKSELLKQILNQTYNHFITFGITNVDASGVEYADEHPEDWFELLFMLLESLETRAVTGNAAREAITDLMSQTTKEDAELLLGILKSDLRIGAGTRVINKAFPDLLPEAFCMSANKYSSKKVTFPVWADTKLDGIRCIAVVGADGVTLFSRNGKVFNNYTTIESEIKLLDLEQGTKLDGEITMGHFQDLIKTMGKKDGTEAAKDAVYNIFDYPEQGVVFKDRLDKVYNLQSKIESLGLSHVKQIDGIIIKDEAELQSFYEAQLAKGEEGAMIKTLDGLYEFKRGWGWQKMKPEHTEDIEIIGVEEGSGKYEGQLGAFICKLDNGVEVKVGSGLKDEEREELWNRRNDLIGELIEVKFQEKTKDGSLRFPIFIRFRPDKS